jgi:NADPH:quinone reductase-like Zn-dependent oxidoreductase
MRAVRFDHYGGPEVIEVRDVDDPVPGAGWVRVRVEAAGLNPGELAIRQGLLHERFPATFPSGQGTDFAGIVDAVGDGVSTVAVGDEVLGWSEERSSQAELVVVPAEQVTPKPGGLSWEVAGALFVASMAAYASVHAVAPRPGETVVVSGAAGGVGSIAVQLARRTGATVIGLAGPGNHAWLQAHDVVPVAYGPEQADRIREASGGEVDAFIDLFGSDYLDLAAELGVEPGRMNTIIDFAAAERLGVSTLGTHSVSDGAARLGELAELVASGELEVPVAGTYPLEQVRAAAAVLADRHTHGKLVLLMAPQS